MEPPNIPTWNVEQEKAKTQKLSLSNLIPALGIQYRPNISSGWDYIGIEG
jgi:hypothetical protein